MLGRSERQLIRVSTSSPLTRSAVLSFQYAGRQGLLNPRFPQLTFCVGRREISVGSITRGRRTTDQVLRVLAVNYVDGVNQWKSSSSRGQYRTVSTETRTPDTKPFPLPTTQPQQQPNARTPPPPMPPPPPPPTSPSQKPDSSVSADAANSPTTASTTAQDAINASEPELSGAIEKKDKPDKD